MAEALEEYAGLQDERAERAAEGIPVFASAFIIVLAGAVLAEGVIAVFMPLMMLCGPL